jgi:hypothetical protein
MGVSVGAEKDCVQVVEAFAERYQAVLKGIEDRTL